ncbi:MAG: hypothetical protein DHS20C18_46110 [Saprospiraceae bacterium]|nr:MAG: hypothetical protein DHS20C18_46110 [Saprospiraceae bacterium]
MSVVLIRVLHIMIMLVLILMFLVIVGGNVAIAIYANKTAMPDTNGKEQEAVLDSEFFEQKDVEK